MRSVLSFVLFIFCGDACAKAETFSNIFLDRKSNARVSLAQDGERRLTTNGRAMNVALSGDRRTAAWLVRETWELDGQRHVTADTLMAYRGGRYRRIKCSPFIRSYWFWNGGKQLAIDCGGLHFAGTLSVYDFATDKLVDSFFQPDIPEAVRPAWSMPAEGY